MKMLKITKNFIGFSILLISCYQYAESLVVPQELPSILSLIYSNIPPLKKGTDSRLGFGFRLGEHADFQVLVELGPQKETRPLGEQTDASDSTFKKRQTDKQDQKAALRQLLRFQQEQLLRQQQKRQQNLPQQHSNEQTTTEHTATSWLESWSNNMNTTITNKKKIKQKEQSNHTAKKQHEKGVPIQTVTMPLVADQRLKQLQVLYKMATTTAAPITTVEQVVATNPPAKTKTINDTKENSLQVPVVPASIIRPQEAQLQTLQQQKSKSEITKELMDVSLEEDGV